jgi:hypothetical protein
MPRVLEFKELDGAIWAKLDIDLEKDRSPIHLYTAAEMAELRRSERNAALEEAAETALGLREFRE